jgi:hypothetical protein
VTGQKLRCISIFCVCGSELGKIFVNVLSMNAAMKCEQCGKINEFRHSLVPVEDKAEHRFPEGGPTIRTSGGGIRDRM